MKIYISGPMSGLPNLNFGEFEEAETNLNILGHESVNPHNLIPKDTPYNDALKVDIRALVDCEAIVMLPGWPQSKGAMLEFNVAASLGLKIFFGVSHVPLGLV